MSATKNENFAMANVAAHTPPKYLCIFTGKPELLRQQRAKGFD